jgi:hypothetical protein
MAGHYAAAMTRWRSCHATCRLAPMIESSCFINRHRRGLKLNPFVASTENKMTAPSREEKGKYFFRKKAVAVLSGWWRCW